MPQERDWTEIAARLLDEGLIALSEAAKLLPPARRRNGGVRHVSLSAIVRWVLDGKRGVHLEACRGPGKTWWTSRPAVARFLAALTEPAANRPDPVARVLREEAGRADRERRAKAAMAELERRWGIGRKFARK